MYTHTRTYTYTDTHSHTDSPTHQGDVSPESDPGRYIQSLQQLISWYWSSAAAAAGAPPGAPPPPLVINTHGWVAGVGLELLAELLRAAAPTHGGRAGLFWALDKISNKQVAVILKRSTDPTVYYGILQMRHRDYIPSQMHSQ